jgi:hypothetical protein
MINRKGVGKNVQSAPIASRELISCDVRVFDTAEQNRGIIEMPFPVAGIGLVSRSLEDQRAELVGDADGGCLACDNVQRALTVRRRA